MAIAPGNRPAPLPNRGISDDYGIARVNVAASPLFLREAEVARGVALLMTGHAELMRRVDPVLRRAGIGRAHYRVLAQIVRWPGCTVSDLIALSGTSKQAIGRVLRELVARGLVEQRMGLRDRRQRLMAATGVGVETELAVEQALRTALAEAYAGSGQQAVTGFWQVLEGLIPVATRLHHADLERRPER